MRGGRLARLPIVIAALAAVASCEGEPPQPGPVPFDPLAGTGQFLAGRDDTLHRIPVIDANGDTRLIASRVCLPDGPGRHPVAVVGHTGPPANGDRGDVALTRCGEQPVRWLVDHGWIVVVPLRRGYGYTGGDWDENPGACANPDYVRAGLEGARDLAAALRYGQSLPDAREDHAVVVGEDAGGWAALALAGQGSPGLADVIVVGAGAGGRAGRQLGHVCRPDKLVEAAAAFGALARVRARLPTLWVYARNDRVFPPAMAEALHDAYVGAGGTAELVQPDGPKHGEDGDGHSLLFVRDGAPIWSGLFAYFLGVS